MPNDFSPRPATRFRAWRNAFVTYVVHLLRELIVVERAKIEIVLVGYRQVRSNTTTRGNARAFRQLPYATR